MPFVFLESRQRLRIARNLIVGTMMQAKGETMKTAMTIFLGLFAALAQDASAGDPVGVYVDGRDVGSDSSNHWFYNPSTRVLRLTGDYKLVPKSEYVISGTNTADMVHIEQCCDATVTFDNLVLETTDREHRREAFGSEGVGIE